MPIEDSDFEFLWRMCGVRRSMVWNGHHVEYFMDEVSAKDAGLPDDHPEFRGWEHVHWSKGGSPHQYNMIVFMEDPFGSGKSPHILGRWRLAFPFEDSGMPRTLQEQARSFLDRVYPNGAEGSAEPGPSSESGWMDRRRERMERDDSEREGRAKAKREEERKAEGAAWEEDMVEAAERDQKRRSEPPKGGSSGNAEDVYPVGDVDRAAGLSRMRDETGYPE